MRFWLLLLTLACSPLTAGVNVITGQYVEHAVDLQIPGFALSRSYTGPGRWEGRDEPACWTTGRSWLRTRDGTSFVVQEPFGSRLSFDGTSWQPAVTNRSIEPIDGGYLLHIGEDRFFFEGEGPEYPLSRIVWANGQEVSFVYEEGVLKRVDGAGDTLHFQYGKSTTFVPSTIENCVTTSSGEEVRYTIAPACQLLTRVEIAGQLPIGYEYDTSTHSRYTEQKGLYRLIKRWQGENYLRNTYYEVEAGRKSVQMGDVRVEHPDVNCVKAQYAPVGLNGEEVCVAQYRYHFSPWKNHTPGGAAGFAEVWDALGNRTVYRWGCGQKMRSIERHEGHEDLLRMEKMLYRDGEIAGVVCFDDQQRAVAAVTYDEGGATLWGDLSGHCAASLELDEAGFPIANGIESNTAPLSFAPQMASAAQLEGEAEYDQAGRCTAVEIEGRRYSYTYDPLSRLTSVTYPSSVEAHFEYDALGRVVSSPAGQFEYDSLGNCTKAVRVEGIDRYRHNIRGQLAEAHYADGTSEECSYNLAGQLVRKAERTGRVTEASYDGLGRLEMISDGSRTLEFSYEGGLTLTASEGGQTVVQQYDANGLLLSEQLPSGLSLSHTYDDEGRRTSTHFPDGSLVEYEHDAFGVCSAERTMASGRRYWRRIIQRDETGRPLVEESEIGTWSYRWDSEGRLLESHTPDGQVAYLYDCEGRLIERTGADASGSFCDRYSYDDHSQLIEERGEFCNTFAYDSLGNRLSGPSIELPEELEPTDTLDRRSSRFLYDGLIEIGEFPSNLRIVMDDGCGRPRTIAVEIDGEPYYTTTNQRGDITALIDQRGRAVEVAHYSAFGEQSVWGEELSPWGFADKRRDPNGLIYFGRRYYAPPAGRWLTPDPAGYVDGPNLYAYCHNNPFQFRDWLGESSEPVEVVPPRPRGPRDHWELWSPLFEDHSAESRWLEDGIVTLSGIGVLAHQLWHKIFPKGAPISSPRRWLTAGAATMQVAMGAFEISIGGRLVVSGALSPVGVLLIAHGFDQAFAGVKTLWSGEPCETVTQGSLEFLGLSPEIAGYTDAAIGIVALGVGGAVVHGTSRVVLKYPNKVVPTLEQVAPNVWESLGGLRYAGVDGRGVSRVKHVLKHVFPDSSRRLHTVFNVTENEVFALIDEAWLMRKPSLGSFPEVFDIPMGRVVGTRGETAIRIVVEKGTVNVRTAYPVVCP